MSKIRIKTGNLRKLGGLLFIIAAVGVLMYGGRQGWGARVLKTVTLGHVKLDNTSDAPSLTGTAKAELPLPETKPATLPPNAPNIHIGQWAWQTQAGWDMAVGGKVTTKGSLFEKFGLRGTVERIDETPDMVSALTATIKEMHDGNANPDGVNFVGIMGDQSMNFLVNANREIVKAYGPEYALEIVGSAGYSRGEDQLQGDPKYLNPKNLKGAVVIAAPYEGDANIAIYLASENGIAINPEFKTYDPTALNFVAAKSYTDAAEQWCNGYSEKRKIKGTTRDTTVNADLVATWTPGDVTVANCAAKQHRPVARIVSTKEYANQMPHVIIGIKKWNETHADAVTKMLAATSIAGNQILTFPRAFQRAMEIQRDVNHEAGYTSDTWKRYYLGDSVVVKDDSGHVLTVALVGGSKVNNYTDQQRAFGLLPGSTPQTSRFNSTFTTFGKFLNQLYPNILDHVIPMDSAVNLTYLRKAETLVGEDAGTAETSTFSVADTITRTVSNASVSIAFKLGSAELTPLGKTQLDRLFERLSTNDLMVEVNGFTDALGNAAANVTLSQARADAVKSYLEGKDANVFPSGRVRATGYGASRFLDGTGKSPANRRVEIRTGQ
jgi:OOP family OmpA-OmpF porin